MVNVPDLMMTSLDSIVAYGLTGEYRFTLDELQDATIANTEEKIEITGKQGRKLSSLKKNKAVKVSGTNGILSAGMMEAQTGSKFTHHNDAIVEQVDYLTITNNAATTDFAAIGTAGAEIRDLYIIGANNLASEKLSQANAVATGKFTYDPTTKALAFANGAYTNGTSICVFYTRQVVGDVLENVSDKYSERLRVIINGTAEDKCGTIYRVQYLIPKGDFNGNFDVALGGDQTVQAFEIESLAGSCGGSGSMWRYTVFTDEDSTVEEPVGE